MASIITNTSLRISDVSTKVYKNPCYFVNTTNNFLYWEIYVKMFNRLKPIGVFYMVP